MCTHSIPAGRRRTLDRNKKQRFCDAVARGATTTEAAIALGVSLRTVQREARRDPEFDQALRGAQHAPTADPLTLMQSHARSHWRAAAWLLERQDPERYARRSPAACSPAHFQRALDLVVEAALEAVDRRSPPAARHLQTPPRGLPAGVPKRISQPRRLVRPRARVPDQSAHQSRAAARGPLQCRRPR